MKSVPAYADKEKTGSDRGQTKGRGEKHKTAAPATQPITRETLLGYKRASPWQ